MRLGPMSPRFFAPVLAFAGLLEASAAKADELEPRRVVIEDRGPNRMLLATGIATLGFAYGVSGWVGATSPHESERFLLVPVLGPWGALAEREHCGPSPAVPCDRDHTYEGLIVASGAMQLAGVAQIAFAFVKRERREVERPLVMPVAFRAGAGLGATATF